MNGLANDLPRLQIGRLADPLAHPRRRATPEPAATAAQPFPNRLRDAHGAGSAAAVHTTALPNPGFLAHQASAGFDDDEARLTPAGLAAYQHQLASRISYSGLVRPIDLRI